MKLDDLYPSRWLKSADVAKPILATIQSVAVEEVGDDEHKPVVTFAGNFKPLVLNRTNALTISGIYGEDTDLWVGKPIVLFSTKVPFQGKLTDAIRVREPRQPAAPAAPAGKPTPPAQAPTAAAAVAAPLPSFGGDDDVAF